MPRIEVKNEVFEDLHNNEIIFRNFAGQTDQFNAQGKRQFSIVLTPERAADLSAKGWNVKLWRSRNADPEEEGTAFISVEANMDGPYPPKVCLLSGTYNTDGSIDIRQKTNLDSRTIGLLDHANLEKVDIIITPYVWEWNGRSGVKAYAKAIYATTILDPLELKYADVGEAHSLAPNPYEDREVPFE